MEYATLTIDPSYGDWRLHDGEDHQYSDMKKLNDLAEKGWRVIGSKMLKKPGYSLHVWHLLLKRDTDLQLQEPR